MLLCSLERKFPELFKTHLSVISESSWELWTEKTNFGGTPSGVHIIAPNLERYILSNGSHLVSPLQAQKVPGTHFFRSNKQLLLDLKYEWPCISIIIAPIQVIISSGVFPSQCTDCWLVTSLMHPDQSTSHITSSWCPEATPRACQCPAYSPSLAL